MKAHSFLRWSWAVMVLTANSVFAQSGSLVTVDEPGICIKCHENTAMDMRATHVHTALNDGKCSDCHNPHASKHAMLLTDTVGDLCLSCHEVVRDKSVMQAAHIPVAEGACMDCHDPHSSTNPNQLTSEMISLCSTCHNQVLSWGKKAVVHDMVADGDCVTCHDPHGSGVDGLLSTDVPALCLNCHEPDEQFSVSHESPEIQHADCRTCHDPHATETKGLLRSNQHAPFADGNCDVCHEQSSGAKAFAIKNTPERLCKMCHRDVGKTEMATATTYRHSETRESYCVDCHNPHTSDVEHILIAGQSVLCMRCHFNTANHSKKSSEYLTHEGQDCSTCHNLHDADNETLLISQGSDLCAGCHQRAHSVSHPLGEDVIDPRDNKPMTCLDCHQMHGADFDLYLPLDPKMALCIQCHKR